MDEIHRQAKQQFFAVLFGFPTMVFAIAATFGTLKAAFAAERQAEAAIAQTEAARAQSMAATRQTVLLERQLKLAEDQFNADRERIANERAAEQARAWQRYRRDLAEELAQMPRFALGYESINLNAAGRATTTIKNVGETAAMRVLLIDTEAGTFLARQDRMEPGQGAGVMVEYAVLNNKGVTIRFQTMFGSTWAQNLRIQENVLIAEVLEAEHTYGPPDGPRPDEDDLQGVIA